MIEKIITYIYRKRALYGLRRKYLLDIAVKQILKDWITDCIVDRRQESRRNEFVEADKELKEMELFRKWIKSQK